MRLVTIYNLATYPVAIAVFRLGRVPCAAALDRDARLDSAPAWRRRRSAAARPCSCRSGWPVLRGCGWLPGGVLFPAIISWRTSPPLSWQTWGHFAASFTLSGLIALAYSLCGSQFIVERALYPRMWDDVRDFTATTRRELAPMTAPIEWIQRLSVPFRCAAISIERAWARPTFTGVHQCRHGFIVLGMFGSRLATRATRHLTDTAVALTGIKA